MVMHPYLRLPIVINMIGLMLGSVGLIIATNDKVIISIGHISLFLFSAVWTVYSILFTRDCYLYTKKYKWKWLTPNIFYQPKNLSLE